jgi:HlyD family secretion protein
MRLYWSVALVLMLTACENGEPTVVGTLERDRLDLIAEAQERIVSLPVREGEQVTSGQVLVQLDTERFQAQLDQARANREQAAQKLAEVRRGPRATEISEAEAALAGAEGQLVTARNELERMGKLVAAKLMAPTELDRARASYDAALAARDEASARLRQLRQGATLEELEQAQAALAAADAAVRQLEVTGAYLTVTAPRSATVDALPFHVGERPPVGGVIAILLASGPPYARVYIPEPLRPHIRPGDSATVQVDGFPQPFKGRVRNIAVEAAFTPYYALTERDRSRLAYLAKIDLTEPTAETLPTGLPVVVSFDASQANP